MKVHSRVSYSHLQTNSSNHLVIVVNIFVWFLLAIQTNVILFDSVLGGWNRHCFYVPGPDTSDV